MKTYPVPIPYEGDQELKLQSRSPVTDDAPMEFIVDEVSWLSDELERIMRAAVILKAANPEASFMECLDTAIIWERG
jgi:hypothetical protein